MVFLFPMSIYNIICSIWNNILKHHIHIGFTGGKVLKDKSNEETDNVSRDLINQTIKSHTE